MGCVDGIILLCSHIVRSDKALHSKEWQRKAMGLRSVVPTTIARLPKRDIWAILHHRISFGNLLVSRKVFVFLAGSWGINLSKADVVGFEESDFIILDLVVDYLSCAA